MTTAGIISLLTVIGSIILAVLKQRQANAPQRKQEDENEKAQQGRMDIANGNGDTLAERIDRVQQPYDGDTPRLGTDEDTARRLAKITGG